MTTPDIHVPVLCREVEEALAPRPDERIFDGTLGAGGHALLLAPRLAPGGLYVGLDRDDEILAFARERLRGLGPLVRIIHGTFDDIEALAREHTASGFDAVLLDLGASSLQLERAERGFSFERTGPLDMRMDPSQRETAADLLGRVREEELADLIFRYGEERLSRRIARAIVSARRRARLETTSALADVVAAAVPRGYERGRIHPATRTFQALRIAVNDELGMLERALEALPRALAPGGRAAVISFHSLEDRIVKHAFRSAAKAGLLEIATKKPIVASELEVVSNRRARSAKLRVARRAQQ